MMRALPSLLAAVAVTAAAETAAPRTELAVGVIQEHLTRDLPDWRSRYLTLEHHHAGGSLAYVGWRDTERYRLRDGEVHGGGYLQLSATLQLQLEAGLSESHRVLSRNYGLLGLNYQPFEGWGLSAGLRRTRYDAGMTGMLTLGVEHYFGNERVAWTVFAGGPDGAPKTSTNRLQWNHYYSDRDWIGVSLADGRETEHDGTGRFITSSVSSVALTGRHDIGKGFALDWEAGRQRQGALYTRSGLRLGLRYAF